MGEGLGGLFKTGQPLPGPFKGVVRLFPLSLRWGLAFLPEERGPAQLPVEQGCFWTVASCLGLRALSGHP